MLHKLSTLSIFKPTDTTTEQRIKITLLTLFVAFCLNCNAQKTNKVFLTTAFQIDVPKNTNGLGGRVACGANINQQLLLGVGFGVTKMQDVDKTITPVFVHFGLGDFSKKVFPYFIAEPGYGLYEKSEVTATETIITKGGFNFYGGAGMGVSTGKKSKATFTIGYSLYNFNTEGIDSSLRGVSFKIAFLGI